MVTLGLAVGPFALTLSLGRRSAPAEDSGDYADITAADLTRPFPVGFCAPYDDEEDPDG